MDECREAILEAIKTDDYTKLDAIILGSLHPKTQTEIEYIRKKLLLNYANADIIKNIIEGFDDNHNRKQTGT